MDTSPSDTQSTESPETDPQGPLAAIRPHPWVAWVIVLAIVALTIVLQSFADSTAASTEAITELAHEDALEATSELNPFAAKPDAAPTGLGDNAMVIVQGRPTLGLIAWMPEAAQSQIAPLLDNPQPVQVIRGLILQAVTTPTESIEQLRSLSQAADLPSDVSAAASDAANAIAGHSEARQDALREQLGWFGTLAWAIGNDDTMLASMKDSAKTTVIMLGLGLACIALAAIVGLVLLIVALVKVTDGSLPSGLQASSPLHGLYAETFALWLVLLNVLSIAAALVAQAADVTQFTALLVFFPASLVALAWPSIRGSTFARTCADIGWTRGRGVIRECGAGLIGWMGMLPIQLVGIACTYGLMMLAGVADGDSDAPTHPIIDALGDPVAVLGAFMVAIVLAPIVEETAFRGLLYRQLRSLSAFGRGALSVTISAVVTGLLFAAIHPQGLLAIPALMSIAIAVALAREWRGSLIAPMIMHGMNNALAVTALLIIIKG